MPRLKSTHVDDPLAVGRRLKEARLRANLSQRDLSFQGCTAAYISRIEAGDRIPSLQILRELGSRLGVSADYLATGQEEARGTDVLVDAEVALRLDDLEQAEQLFEDALASVGSDQERAVALAGLGHVAFRRGDPKGAIQLLEHGLTLLGADAVRHPTIADTLGRAYAAVGELAPAIGIFQRFLDASRERNDFVETVRFAVLLSNALIDRGSFGDAERVLGETLAIARESRNPVLRARLYWSQSRLHAEQNDPQTAARYARRALELLELTEQTHHTALAHQLLAHIELDRGRPEAALDLLQEGWPLLADTGSKLEQAQYRLEEARALAALGRGEEAASMAMSISGLLGDANPEDAGRTYGILAQIFESVGDTSRALELYELAAELLERNPNRYLVDVYSRLADLLEREGRREEAYRALRRAVGLQVEIGARPAAARAADTDD